MFAKVITKSLRGCFFTHVVLKIPVFDNASSLSSTSWDPHEYPHTLHCQKLESLCSIFVVWVYLHYLCQRLASEGIVTLGVTLSRCVCVRHISHGGEGIQCSLFQIFVVGSENACILKQSA